MPKIVNFARFWKPDACSPTVLPDRSTLIRQKLVENAKVKRIQMRFFGDFQTMWMRSEYCYIAYLSSDLLHWNQWIKRANEAWNQIHTTLLLWFLFGLAFQKKFQRFSVFLSEKSAPNPRDHDLDSDDDPSSNNHVLAIWHRQLLFTNPNLDRFELRLNWKWMEFNSGKTADVSGQKRLVHKTARRSRCNWSIFNHFKA